MRGSSRRAGFVSDERREHGGSRESRAPCFVGPSEPEAAAAKEVDEKRKWEVRQIEGTLRAAEDRVRSWTNKQKDTERVVKEHTTKISWLKSELAKYWMQLKTEK